MASTSSRQAAVRSAMPSRWPRARRPKASAELNRGAYLVGGPGHCGECHSPRNSLGGTIQSQAFAGARNPEGKGKIPNITPSHDGLGDWSTDDITYLLETGNTPDFDVI